MRICNGHWARLRSAITKYELDHLIPPDGAGAAAILKRQLEGGADFDPLMNANNALWSVSLNFCGSRMLADDACPVCELEKYDWIDGAAFQSRIYAEKHGLMLPDVARFGDDAPGEGAPKSL